MNTHEADFWKYGTSATDIYAGDIIFCNHDIYYNKSDYSGYGSNGILYKSATGSDVNYADVPYAYQYDSSIPNVENMTIQKDALWRPNSWFVIGESKTKYIVKWSAPGDTGLKLEIACQSTFNNIKRRYSKQSYQRIWNIDEDIEIKCTDETMKLDINQLAQWNKKVVWTNFDTGNYTGIPVTEMYYRYYIKDDVNHKIKYGSWTRLDFAGGQNGIVETQRDMVTTDEQEDPETGEITYTDTPIDGNQTVYCCHPLSLTFA